jgi:hypothetical protein
MAIASCLVDTNILLRVTSHSDPQHKLIDSALTKLALDSFGEMCFDFFVRSGGARIV